VPLRGKSSLASLRPLFKYRLVSEAMLLQIAFRTWQIEQFSAVMSRSTCDAPLLRDLDRVAIILVDTIIGVRYIARCHEKSRNRRWGGSGDCAMDRRAEDPRDCSLT
jgi:hypothetical protein